MTNHISNDTIIYGSHFIISNSRGKGQRIYFSLDFQYKLKILCSPLSICIVNYYEINNCILWQIKLCIALYNLLHIRILFEKNALKSMKFNIDLNFQTAANEEDLAAMKATEINSNDDVERIRR